MPMASVKRCAASVRMARLPDRMPPATSTERNRRTRPAMQDSFHLAWFARGRVFPTVSTTFDVVTSQWPTFPFSLLCSGVRSARWASSLVSSPGASPSLSPWTPRAAGIACPATWMHVRVGLPRCWFFCAFSDPLEVHRLPHIHVPEHPPFGRTNPMAWPSIGISHDPPGRLGGTNRHAEPIQTAPGDPGSICGSRPTLCPVRTPRPGANPSSSVPARGGRSPPLEGRAKGRKGSACRGGPGAFRGQLEVSWTERSLGNDGCRNLAKTSKEMRRGEDEPT
eukprot:scaffold271_cov336-Pavlova_lutheri.AAC.50